ncbi:MAG: hypothetical protein BMS9Abin13_666 [Patescibacteria group bacterium]|nr:MAG: hypothetical protein BMS9Abin13_666 [Patescibacteria group bacterium]
MQSAHFFPLDADRRHTSLDVVRCMPDIAYSIWLVRLKLHPTA